MNDNIINTIYLAGVFLVLFASAEILFHKFKVSNDLLGIFYMLLCQFSFATNDAFVKVIYENYDEIFVLNQIVFIRGIFTLFFILLFLYIKKAASLG